MKAIISFLFSIILVSFTFSQPFGQQWVSRYNGPGNTNDFAYKLALDNAGNVYVTGYSTGATTGKDMFTMKYNANGTQLWTARYNGPNNGGDYSFDIVVDQVGNSYVTGRSDRGGNAFSDITTIKYDVNGNQQWVALYDGPMHSVDEGEALAIDQNGNVFVTGKAYISLSLTYDIVTIKYNSSGAQQWVKTYNGAGNNQDIPHAIALDNLGNIYVCGEAVGAATGADFVLLKYSSDGTQAWVKTYNGPDNGGDGANALGIDGSGFVYVTGTSYGGSAASYDFATLKYDPTGNQIWVKRFNGVGTNADIPNALAVDNFGDVIVTGSSVGVSGGTDSNFATVKYSPSGNLLWVEYYARSGVASDVSRAVTTDQNGNVYVTGNSSIIGFPDDYTTIKYDPDGVPLWVFIYNGPDNNNDYTNSIAVDDIGAVYVTGRSYSISGGYDFATIKYSDLVGLNQTGTTIPDKYNLYQNYPNPFNPVTKIKFDISMNSPVTLAVYDILGQVVSTDYFGEVQPGTYEFVYDASSKGLTSGIYFYELKTNEYFATRKMVLTK